MATQAKNAGPVQLRTSSVKVPLPLVVIGWLFRKLGRVLGWLVVHPLVTVPAVLIMVGVYTWHTVSPWPVVAAAGGLLAGGVAWRFLGRDSFYTRVVWRIKAGFKQAFIYRFGWQPAMHSTGLIDRIGGVDRVPTLVRVRSTATVDRVTVRMLPGQVLADYVENANRLARTFDAQDCRVRSHPKKRALVVLCFLTADPLQEPVLPFTPDEPVDLAALPVALREDGPIWQMPMLGTHWLVAGATGSGKGSVFGSVLNACGPAIRDGLVEVWALDPKGGMELAPWAGLCTRFCYGSDNGDTDAHEFAFADLLEDGVALMRIRTAELRGYSRQHVPSTDEPLTLILVDELASLTAYITNKDARRRIAAALSLLLSQGRAVGVLVGAAVQDPRKETVPFRDLFPLRIGLRMTEAGQVPLALGEAADALGARCEQIPRSLPGIGYVTIEGTAEPVRVRFSYISDTAIGGIVQTYAPGTPPAELRLVTPTDTPDVAA